MFGIRSEKSAICNYIAVVLLVAMLVFIFTPFWTEKEEKVSVGAVVWFPQNHRELAKTFTAMLQAEAAEGEKVTYGHADIVLKPILIMASAVAGIILCLVKAKNSLRSIIPGFCGVVSIITFSSMFFREGQLWWLPVIFGGLLVALAAVSLFFGFKERER